MTIDESSSSQQVNKSGSPRSGGPVFLTLGKLQRTHGVKGELIMEVHTDFPEKILAGRQVFIGPGHHEYTINSVRPNGDRLLVSFIGLTDCDQASILRNQLVYIRTEDANQLPEGEFYHHEITGIQVYDEKDQLIGTIDEILVTGANDVYVIKDQAGVELLIPAIRTVVLSVDRKKRKMVVRLPEWE